MYKNRFFENNFLDFLKENEKFFKNHRLKFAVNLLEILKKKNPGFQVTEKYKDFVTNLYDFLFIKGDFETGVIRNYAFFDEIKQNSINFTEILDKTFILMINSFLKYVIKEKNSIETLKKFVNLCEFYKEYLSFHTKDEYIATSKLPKEIKHYYLHNTPLSLFSVYKGIPISHKTFINTLNENKGIVEVEANYYQIIASKFKKEIYLLEPKSNNTFKAYISQAYVARKVLELYNIEKVNRKAPKRNFIRVQPKEEIIVTLTKNNKAFKTKMYDISIKGTAVTSEEKLPLQIGDILTIQFLLESPEVMFFTLQGELKSITKLSSEYYRYHFYFEPNPKEEKMLEKYITKREKEIIRELQIYLKREIKPF
jgi:hypothetical protein